MQAEQTPRTALSTIGGWKLGKTLGRGAYAHVRLATHRNGHKAACKILPALHRPRSTPASWDEVIDAVEAHKELVLLKALAGSGIEGLVGLEGVIVEGGWTYVFLTLYNQSASSVRAPWTWPKLVPFVRRLCHTIHGLHLLGVSHEDLKRSNILIDDRGRPVVVDFGFSQFSPDGGRVKSAGGTLDYSSPEKVKDSLYDPRANDVWSLAILLIKLLGLPHPFAELGAINASQRMKERISTCEPNLDWKEGLNQPQHSRSLVDLLCRMLQKDPKRRITIPDILAHPYLLSSDIQKTYIPPQYDLSTDIRLHLTEPIFEDVCFLAYLNKDFVLCESLEKVKEKVLGAEPCWEKRWAGLLCRWKQSPEMRADDTLRGFFDAVSVDAGATPKSIIPRPLREIHLSPNVLAGVTDAPVKDKSAIHKRPPNAPQRAEARRAINGHMKTRAASGTTVSPESNDVPPETRGASGKMRPVTRAATQQQRPIKTPDRVDFRARTYPAPLIAKRNTGTNIPDLAALRKGLEESSEAKSHAVNSHAASPSIIVSKNSSKRSESSMEDTEEHQQRTPPAKKPSAKQPKAGRGKTKAPLRRSTRLQGSEDDM